MLRSPMRAAIAVAFIVLMAWTIQSLFQTTYFTVVAVLLVWGQVAGFFVPTRYELTDEKVAVRGLVSRREKWWGEFRSYHVDRDGLLLSPFVDRSRLERFRGVSLQFHGNRDEVVAFVERQMERRGEDGGTEPDEPGGGNGQGTGSGDADAGVGNEGQGERTTTT
ncbi:MAG: hypothetical protein JXB46_08630 [Candidatus Eisenbacteria bacterium]|nr:hypothetical protein [Candidatus Eisenbacteria bacterium]